MINVVIYQYAEFAFLLFILDYRILLNVLLFTKSYLEWIFHMQLLIPDNT